MPSNLIKGLIGLAGATTIGGGVATIYLTTNNSKTEKQTDDSAQNVIKPTPTNTSKAISAWLNDEGKSLLGDDSAEWDNNWKKFKANYAIDKLPEDAWKLSDWSDVFNSEKAPQSFKDKCQSNTNTVVDSLNSPLYIQLKTNCTQQSAP